MGRAPDTRWFYAERRPEFVCLCSTRFLACRLRLVASRVSKSVWARIGSCCRLRSRDSGAYIGHTRNHETHRCHHRQPSRMARSVQKLVEAILRNAKTISAKSHPPIDAALIPSSKISSLDSPPQVSRLCGELRSVALISVATTSN